MPKFFITFFKLGIAGFVVSLAIIAISNTGLTDPNWPFELFASFMRHMLVLFPVVFVISAGIWRRALGILLLIGGLAFWPFFTFSKFQTPTQQACAEGQCLTFVFSNIHKHEASLEALGTVSLDNKADVLAISELPSHMTEKRLRVMFPHYEHIFSATVNPEGKVVGSGLAILSRYPLTARNVEAVPTLAERFWDRVFLEATLEMPDKTPLKIFVVHPRYPMSRIGSKQRKLMLDGVSEAIGEDDNFVMLGDLNMTPWTPDFKKLHGKRAGDPRWIYTWDAERPWLAIPIDHIMVGADIEVTQSEVLPGIGSDHRPILATLRTRRHR